MYKNEKCEFDETKKGKFAHTLTLWCIEKILKTLQQALSLATALAEAIGKAAIDRHYFDAYRSIFDSLKRKIVTFI